MKWKKPSGLEIETNDKEETIKYCKSLGWKRVGGNAPKDEPAPVSKIVGGKLTLTSEKNK